MKQKHIAIFGPTGYIGTRMIIQLYNMDCKVSLFSRTVRKLDYIQDECVFLNSTNPNVCIVEQLLEEKELDNIAEALKGVDVVYYLVHSLYILEKQNFMNQDNQLAALIAKASTKASVKQIIYLGGLGVNKPDFPISEHLLSRQDTANYLRANHNCVTEFRAGVIIGAGSSSFEIIRSLGTKLPFIPQLYGKEGSCQPIFVDDVIEYLTHAILNPKYFNQIAEIGSKDILTYSKMIQIFSSTILDRQLIMVPLPLFNRLLTPYILSKIISRMTNMPSLLIERLIEGMHSAAIIDKYPIEKIDPNHPITIKSFEESIKIATRRTEKAMYQSVWSTPYELSVLNAEKKKQFLQMDSKEIEGMLYEEYSKKIELKNIDDIFNRIKDIGGSTGYYSPLWMWKIRGFIDNILGGRGLSSNKRDSSLLRVGNRIDFWVVTYYKNYKHYKVLRLKANMITPGNAWLQFTITTSKKNDSAVLSLKAYFEPSGIGGYLYWYSLYFIHKYIFKAMVNNITNINDKKI
jgi:uncharacterized protein YbjT (DUF2867 family)